MRILGIDYGDRFIGVAMSDPLGVLATPLCLIDQKKDNGIQKIKEIVKAYAIQEVVVGLPINMNGTQGPQCEKVREFSKYIEEFASVIFVDERLSTMEADKKMLMGDLSRSKRKIRIDGLSAAIILQTMLDKNKHF